MKDRYIYRNTVKQASFHAHFEDDKHDSISDWKLPSLIKQIVWAILGEESLFGSMNLTLSSLMDLMSVMWHFFDVLLYFTFFDSLHVQRFDPLYLL